MWLTKEKKKELKDAFKKLVDIRTKQIEIFERCLITPLKKNKEMLKQILKERDVPIHMIKAYYKNSEKLNKHIKEFLKEGGKACAKSVKST